MNTPDPLDLIVQANPGVWFETYGKIRNASGKLEAARMNILQRRINAVFLAARRKRMPCYIIGLKPRKKGFSTMGAAITYTELCKNAIESVIVGNKLETSETVFNMIRVFADNDGFKGNWSSPFKATTETIKWQHGSKLAMSTAKAGDSIRGQTPQTIHGTEVAHWDGEEEFLLGLMNALPDVPQVFCALESTPNGNSGAFYERWCSARWPTPDECPKGQEDYWRMWEASCPDEPDAVLAEQQFVRVFAAWFEFEEARIPLDEKQRRYIEATLDEQSWYHGEKALIEAYGSMGPNGKMRLGTIVEDTDVLEQLAYRRATIKNKCGKDPGKFDQEHPRDPSTCFLASGNPVFDADAIEHYKILATRPRDFGTLSRQGERAVWMPTSEDDAIFWRWEQPKLGCSYLISIDTAEGEDQTKGKDPDRHSVLVWRRAYREPDGTLHRAALVARIRPPCRVPMYMVIELADLLSRYYGRCVVIPEMNSSGLAYITGAQMLGTPIWKRREVNPRSGKKEEKLGWRTTDNADYGGLRSLVINALHETLRERYVDIYCPNVVYELSKFVNKSGRMEAGEGAHDDDVMSASIGLYNIDSATPYQEEIVDRRMPRDLQDALGIETDTYANAQRW